MSKVSHFTFLTSMDFLALEKKFDKDNLKKILQDFSKQLEKAYKHVEESPFEFSGNVDKILICGMGGSSLPADMINNLAYHSLEISTCRHYDIPEWVDENTLVFVSSYSGNTEETLSCLEGVQGKTPHIVVITAGGELLKQAKDLKLPYLQIETGIQPRIGTGYFLVYILHVLSSYGLVPDQREDFMAAAEFLESHDFEEEAKDIVGEIGDKLPIVYASTDFSSLARIWKITFNENAKTQAFWYEFPELNHNEMVGFTNFRVDPVFILLKSSFDHPRIQKRMSIFEDLLREKAAFIHVPLQGKTKLEQLLWGLVMGYWVSYYTALSTEINPTPVDMVEEFKELMKK